MRPTFMGFESSKSSIFANQKAIDIVGSNLANIDTNGYTRQRVDVASLAAASRSNRVSTSRVGLSGMGVEATGVSQLRDSFLDKRFRDEYSKSSYHGKAVDILSDIQTTLGDGNITDTSGILGSLEQIYKSLTDFAATPTVDTQANLVMAAFKNIAQVLQQLDTKLTGVAQQQTYDMGLNVDRVNEISEEIANLNKIISDDTSGQGNLYNEHYHSNELYDRRNLLLDELSGYGDISTTQLSNGIVNVQMGGASLVSGVESNKIAMSQNADNTVNIKWISGGENVKFTGGTLKSSVEFLNGRGRNVQNNIETPQQGVPYYRDRINTFAATLGEVVNNIIPEQIDSAGKPVHFDKNGDPMIDADRNPPLFDEDGFVVDEEGNKKIGEDGKPIQGTIRYKTLVASGTNGNFTGDITAANISLSKNWVDGGPGYIISSRTNSESSYILQLANALTGKEQTMNSYGEKFTGTFEAYVEDYVAALGSDISFQKGRQESIGRVADDFISRRDEVSGVSRDEETANMLMYQKSYEAAARVMTTLDELLDVVINRMGRVGL